MAVPTFNELYDEVAGVLIADTEHQLDDFTAGSWPDAIAALGAAQAQAAIRRANRFFGRFFRSTATGSDLDALIKNLFGPEPRLDRLTGESDEDYNARVDDYLVNGLVRGTVAALTWLLNSGGLTGVASGVVTEDLTTGLITLTVTPAAPYSSAQAVAAVKAVLDAWRPAAAPTNVVGV